MTTRICILPVTWIVFFTKHEIEVMEHSPCSLDLPLCDFWLYPCLKSSHQGLRFDTYEAVLAKTISHFNAIENLSKCERSWGRDGKNVSRHVVIILKKSVRPTEYIFGADFLFFVEVRRFPENVKSLSLTQNVVKCQWLNRPTWN